VPPDLVPPDPETPGADAGPERTAPGADGTP
jgi:hypothetical protein